MCRQSNQPQDRRAFRRISQVADRRCNRLVDLHLFPRSSRAVVLVGSQHRSPHLGPLTNLPSNHLLLQQRSLQVIRLNNLLVGHRRCPPNSLLLGRRGSPPVSQLASRRISHL